MKVYLRRVKRKQAPAEPAAEPPRPVAKKPPSALQPETRGVRRMPGKVLKKEPNNNVLDVGAMQRRLGDSARNADTSVLDNPDLALAEDSGDGVIGFDPYNTGTFDRSRSWEKISKNRS